MTKRVLVWGFYDQGNLGDDLMAIIVAELVRQAGCTPVICSSGSRFTDAGYETVVSPFDANADFVVLGGGAFFKQGGMPRSSIERKVALLGAFLTDSGTPCFGVSLGSDGIDRIEQASPARRSVVDAPGFRGATVRLRKDIALGVSNLSYQPDIVLCTAFLCRDILGRTIPPSDTNRPDVLLNFSRRSVVHFAKALWTYRGQRMACFLAHNSEHDTGGEITFPGVPVYRADDIWEALDVLANAETIVSSKLHPGVIAMSFGRTFVPAMARPKTSAFLAELTEAELEAGDLEMQGRIWREYLRRINAEISGV